MSGIGGVEVPGQQVVQLRLGLWHGGSMDGPLCDRSRGCRVQGDGSTV